MVQLLQTDGVHTGTCNACAFGMMNIQGSLPLWKQYRFLSNSKSMLAAVCLDCPGHAHHATVSGEQSKHSGEYPLRLARAISRAIRALRS